MANSAILAGHFGRVEYIKLTPQELTGRKDRTGRVLSSFKNDPPTAKEWLSFWGRASTQKASVKVILGAGTPFVCLYVFGWFLGKHWVGWLVGALPIVSCWGVLLFLTLGDWSRFAHMWLEILAQGAMLYMFNLLRLESRTPKDFRSVQGAEVGLVLETMLGLIFTCVGLGFGTIADEWFAYRTSKAILHLFASISPVLLWSWMHEVVLDIQTAVLHRHNMGGLMAKSGPRGQKTLGVVRELIEDIVDKSRDLRVTGLSAADLGSVAARLDDDGYEEEAEYIRFYLRGDRPVSLFDRLSAFHFGYIHGMRSGQENPNLRNWVKSKATRDRDRRPFEELQRIRDGDGNLPESLLRELRITGSAPRESDQTGQNWWLCGAIARYRDDRGCSGEGTRGRRVWYALIVAALCADGNALAFMRAMIFDKDHGNRASRVSQAMEEGCEEVLRQITDSKDVYKERGIVMTTSTRGSAPKITYSTAAIWQAETHKESIIMDETAFDVFWHAWDGGELGERETRIILSNSVAWSSKAVSHVDLISTAGPMIHATGSTLVNVRKAAWRGWYMHTLWVVCAIFVHFFFPGRLMYMAAFSAAASELDWNNIYIHSVFVGFHMWRSGIGRVCLLFPRERSDMDISYMSRRAYFSIIVIINWLATYCGMLRAPSARIFFFLAMGISTIPGFVYLRLAEFRQDDHNLIEYTGRSRGPGYEHRRSRSLRRPLGKDVVVEQPRGVFKVLSEHQRSSARQSLDSSRDNTEGGRWHERLFVRDRTSSRRVGGRRTNILV